MCIQLLKQLLSKYPDIFLQIQNLVVETILNEKNLTTKPQQQTLSQMIISILRAENDGNHNAQNPFLEYIQNISTQIRDEFQTKKENFQEEQTQTIQKIQAYTEKRSTDTDTRQEKTNALEFGNIVIDSKKNPELADLVENQRNNLEKQEEHKNRGVRLIGQESRLILRELDIGRGPWGVSLHDKDPQKRKQIHWKLDKTEDSLRRRLKLCVNYKFNEHYEASIRRDEGVPRIAEQLVAEMQSKLAKQAKERMTALEQVYDSGDLDKDQDFDQDGNFRSANKNPNSSNPNNDPDADNDIENDDSNSNSNNNTVIDPQIERKMEEKLQVEEITITQVSCQLISPLKRTPGVIEITNLSLNFFVDHARIFDLALPREDYRDKDYSWDLQSIISMSFRRHLHRNTALEIFFADSTNMFFNFETTSERGRIADTIISTCKLRRDGKIRNLKCIRDGISELHRAQLTRRWKRREVSNFEYLMQLNTLSGRTYNDISQYPVFPWILSDYKSEKLDLSNPESYRDLTKPIGAMDQERLDSFLQRYRSFPKDEIPFLYGTHYSNSNIVVSFLIRMEPFTTYSVRFQGGKFDKADRIFSSIERAWSNCMTGTSDVKELIPEFFYLPEFLENPNNFNLGKLQTGKDIGIVELPPWAKSPRDFVRINRDALESEHVSLNLHHWIDLIFGYKQKGKQAEKSYNIFRYSTYQHLVNYEKTPESQIPALEAEIEYYGQTPLQLFTKPHPARLPFEQAPLRDSHWDPKINHLRFTPFIINLQSNPPIFLSFAENPEIVAFIGASDKIISVDFSRRISGHKWMASKPLGGSTPFFFEEDQTALKRAPIGVSFSKTLEKLSGIFALSGSLLASCGYWDNSFKITNVQSMETTQSIVKHSNIVTCLAFVGSVLVTGSKDTTTIVWSLNSKDLVNTTPTHVLSGHDDEVTCVDFSPEFDVVVSGSKDGTCIIYTLRSGKYVRTIHSPTSHAFSMVKISPDSDIVTFSEQDMSIRLYSINGQFLKEVSSSQILYCWTITKNSRFLITGGKQGFIHIRRLHDLRLVESFDLKNPVNFIALNDSESYLIALFENSKLFVGYFTHRKKKDSKKKDVSSPQITRK
eukprot:Anaeramoba_ignava/c21607_g1_i1.p1 GENE.c21607_g1_i1~~c21607_g1_i1.p1  ORF type:complete len:1101 (-),score=335.69 c21607_g1_i1:108-3410(-)